MKRLLFSVVLASLIGSLSAETAPEAKIAAFRAKARKLVSQMTLAEKRSQLVNGAAGIKRLGIPPYGWWNEALHGVARNGRATVFPQPIGQAASFNPDLIRKVAEDGARVTPKGVYRVIAASAAPGARSDELGVRRCETAIRK